MTTRDIWAETVMARYRDAYRVSRAVRFVGELVKGIGAILAILVGLGLFAAIASFDTRSIPNPLTILGISIAVLIVSTPFWVAGVLIAGVAQMDLASLDSAVNSSPFLDDEQRAAVMSLPAPDGTDSQSNVQVRVPVCEACGVRIEELSAFCPSCGARQEGVAC